MLISDVMRLSGLSRKAIYLYEEKGLLAPSKVPAGELRNYREYTEEDLRRLRLIACLRELDLSLSDIEKILHGQNASLILQSHLDKQREKLSELSLIADTLNTVLGRLSPSADRTGMERALQSAMADFDERKLRYKLQNDQPEGATRRVALLLYEAFLDKPLLSKEDWDAWYALLDCIERALSPAAVEAHAEFYGNLTTAQLCEDFSLRRQLVCGYAQYAPEDERKKAQEIISELQDLQADPAALKRWRDYYENMVRPILAWQPNVSAYISRLSRVYDSYTAHFGQMMELYFKPAMQKERRLPLVKALESQVPGWKIFDFNHLIYFDFYNNTLRKLLYET